MRKSDEPLTGESGRSLDGAPSFSLANRFYRLTWGIAWLVLAAWTPPPLHRWRRLILRMFGARIGEKARIYGSARIWSPANLVVAHHATIGPRTQIYSMGQIVIGEYAVVSQGAHLCAGTHDVSDVHFQLHVRPIHIGARAWIAAEAFVGPGVTVGDGVVLGARGCAMRNLEPWTVYSGNPAQPIRPRQFRNAPDLLQP
ncbi:putative colanic acid biosynthesis acetyltransferase [Novosphingobium sp.]|uniref:putative colanic acid biosynthesis acetyltransferase n=1 Tax=Novosphingobium sp. TaxID=1874826 RepID=UPI003B51C586